MLEINKSQIKISSSLFSSFDGKDCSNNILQYFDFPLNTRLEFYDQNGQLFSTYRYEDGSYAITNSISEDPSKKGSISLIWDSPNAIIAFASSKPQLFESIQSQQELKPNRIPHPLDGSIHSIKITWQPDQTPHVEVLYVCAVKSAHAPLSLDQDDIEYAGYLSVQKILGFDEPELEFPGFYNRLS